MASIELTVIGCIDYLAYITIFMRAMFCQKKILDVFFAKKNQNERWELVWASDGPNVDDSNG